MRVATTLTALTSVASGMILPRQESNESTSTPNVVASQYDGYALFTQNQDLTMINTTQLMLLPRP
jgi:hypothetical protein